jgi:hypothetical protein
MSDVIPPGGRALSGAERAAFQQLGLSPGNWAALILAPFLDRAGLRPPDLQQRSSALHLEALRRELRTAAGLSTETGRFWGRVVTAAVPDEVDLATLLLAWHLATDLPFAKRERVLGMFATTAGEFTTATHPPVAPGLVQDLRLLIDYLLPCRSFPTDSAPRWVHIPPPSADDLDAIARTVAAPAWAWPALPAPPDAPPLPVLVRLLGEPAADWWGHSHPGRRAVERGMTILSFAERERFYVELTQEWDRAQQGGAAPEGGTDSGAAFVQGIREWVDAVRKAARQFDAAPERKSGTVAALPSAPSAPGAAPAPSAGGWRCARCGTENPVALRECRGCRRPQLAAAIELRSATGKTLRLEDGMRVGRSEYRAVFEAPDAGLAAADQFEVVRDAARGVWLVRPVGTPRHPTRYQGAEVGAEGCELAAGGVISVGGKLDLVVRFV